ncbi:zinc transporter [Rubricella aquisinus]|uniref:Zinc transporter n=1 Tax=Rubricella aquisinus TaxID=2028108 RepID=A0A840X035_9RHOB|nr:zinc transporter ZntB [Rubricella aquisinus]MBB5514017.1 zinc transporter [Rubricella aquisinus]
MNSAILKSVLLPAQAALDPEDAARALAAPEAAWVHLDATNPAARGWLEAALPRLDTVIVDGLFAASTRPGLIEYGDGALMVLRGINLNEGKRPEDMVSVRIWITGEAIVSVGLQRLRALDDVEARILAGQGPKTPGAFAALLIRRLTERMEPTLSALDEQVTELEERVLDAPAASERREIIATRRRAIVLRRYIAPQREALSTLGTAPFGWLTAADRRDLRDSIERTLRLVEDVDAIRDRAQVVGEELSNALSARLDRNLYILSIISALFLPLGFITGLLGINVGGMPGVDSPSAFWIVTVAIAALGAGGLILFRRLKWF